MRRTRAAAAEAVLQQVVVLREERLGVAGVAPLGNLRDEFVHHELFNTAAMADQQDQNQLSSAQAAAITTIVNKHSSSQPRRQQSPLQSSLPSELASSSVPDLDLDCWILAAHLGVGRDLVALVIHLRQRERVRVRVRRREGVQAREEALVALAPVVATRTRTDVSAA